MLHLHIAKTKNGDGVFTEENVPTGTILLEFHGDIFEKDELPFPYESADDHYMQIGRTTYMGPSGNIDDYVNHSCDPNAGVMIDASGVRLIAIRDIEKNEEITWDYSTTMDEDDWELDCRCGSDLCRKKIRDFKYLDRHLQRKYLTLGIVPDFVSRHAV